jgi:hypothetical protein
MQPDTVYVLRKRGPAAHWNPPAEARSRPVQASAPQPAYDLLLSRDEKHKLAKSAPPPQIADHATVYILDRAAR